MDINADTCYGEPRVRIANGYRLLYMPDHNSAMTSRNWLGFVYEHIVIAEKCIGRCLGDNEVVHHLDMDRLNNSVDNLLVMDRGQHMKLHQWLDRGAPMTKVIGEKRLNSGNTKSNNEPKYCAVCGLLLTGKKQKVCSRKCLSLMIQSSSGRRNKAIPSRDELIQLLSDNSREGVGRVYNVSGNAVKKWMVKYGLDKRILSQAVDKSTEGAETTGVVDPLNNQSK
jgi:hypothetical protein